MKRRRSRDIPLDLDEALRLEGMLNSTIKPMSPNTAFVRSLEERLKVDRRLEELPPSGSVFGYILIVTSVVLAISMITVAGIRLIVAIIGILGLVQQVQADINPPSSQP